MVSQLVPIFFNVVIPVFALVGLSYVLGPILDIQYRSLSRTAYYILIPGFVFNVLSQIQIDLGTAGRMVLGIGAVYCLTGAAGFGLARLMGYGREMSTAFLMTTVFGNVGNFGLALARFRLGEEAMSSATVYMVAVNTMAFTICILSASWVRNGGFGALKSLLKTPGVLVLPVALAFPVTGTAPPMMLQRICGLLGDAMIPVMLLVLGLQLREAGTLAWGRGTLAACVVRLVIGPVLAFALFPLMGLTGVAASAGIVQASMPSAVLTAIIAMEHNVAPNFVTSVVFASTLLSLVSLTLVLMLL